MYMRMLTYFGLRENLLTEVVDTREAQALINLDDHYRSRVGQRLLTTARRAVFCKNLST